MAHLASPNVLVTTEWIADHFDDPHIRLIEVVWEISPVWGMPAYESGHIAGAIAWEFEPDLKDPIHHDVVDKDALEALLGRSGITWETTIVLYSALSNQLATYAFWVLTIYGHQDIRLLDGGRQKWLDEHHPTVSDVPTITPTTYQAQALNWSLRASSDDLLQSIGRADHLLVDLRSVEMYRGENKASAVRGGHIPGAINFPAQRETNPDGSFKGWRLPTVQPDGTFKSVEELRALFDSVGITANKEIITYCVRGGLSTHAWFVLTQLLGYRNVREYDRSWEEWGNAEELPIEC
jgi:thiosulfate/3-mercaptopyruvate sulfurtransferase